MTEPSNTTKARTNARQAKAKATEAAEQAAAAAQTGTESIINKVQHSVQDGFMAVRNSGEAQAVAKNGRDFVRAATPFLAGAALIAAPIPTVGAVLATTGIRMIRDGFSGGDTKVVVTDADK